MDPHLRTRLESASQVLFLCSGNIIRSAFAELYARHLGCPVPVLSAATVYHNTGGVYPATAEALLERGVDPALIRAFEPARLGQVAFGLPDSALVLGMTRDHLRALGAGPPSEDQRFLLTELVGEDTEIADPMFEGGFDECFDQVAACIETLVTTLKSRTPSGSQR